MLSQGQNDVLCRVGPGTPVGQLFRSVWLPALLSSQLPQPGCPPVRVKLLGEELLGVRDRTGRVGFVQANCAHRLAPLFFGHVEEQGIRCAYHGWLYDLNGQCLDMQNEPERAVCAKVKITAYKAVEKSDIIWIYMGADNPPALPKFPWIDLPKSQRNATVWLQETNWLQGVEGEIDSSHVSILHTNPKTLATSPVHQHYSAYDLSPKLFAKDTPIGILAMARRNADGRFYWRVSQWMLPTFSSIPSAAFPIGGRAYVPIDDENAYTWDFNYDLARDLPKEFIDYASKGLAFPPEYTYKPYRLNTGSIIDVYLPIRNIDNDYLIDRKKQSHSSPTGLHGLNDQDRAMQEGMGRIVDRNKEFLVSADVAIVRARRRILGVVQSPESLAAFRKSIESGQLYGARPLDIVSEYSEVDDLLRHFEDRLFLKEDKQAELTT
jgi:phthalate 4,5-dioxygenase oxygenase subunit